MEPTLIKMEAIPEYGEWTSKSVLDPLHPSHGPLPDCVQLWSYDDKIYRVALWVTMEAVLVTVELMAEDSECLKPLKSMDDIHEMRGWILQTYRWKIDAHGAHRKGVVLPFPKTDDEDTWRDLFCRAVGKATVVMNREGLV